MRATVGAILSAGCLVSAGLCLATNYMASAALASSKNFGEQAETIGHMRSLMWSMPELLIAACVLAILAAGLATFAFLNLPAAKDN